MCLLNGSLTCSKTPSLETRPAELLKMQKTPRPSFPDSSMAMLIPNHARLYYHASLLVAIFLLAQAVSHAGMQTQPLETGLERQVTTGMGGYGLTNAFAWSPDSQWIVYDRRDVLAEFNSQRIEQVNIKSLETVVLYQAENGGGCGVVSYHPSKPTVVFIHGPPHPTPDWSYGFTRRRGAWIDTRHPGKLHSLDAMNYSPPFASGALRGGSHIHVFSPDGQWVSFTYEDEILARLDREGGQLPHDGNQRNLGVSIPVPTPVIVNRNHPRNHDGEYFSVLVTRTVAHPRPGSDEIKRACEESWIGKNGYIRSDGSWQKRALAFQGTVISGDGRPCTEGFVVDIPDDPTVLENGPLCGTETRCPAPPKGATQRRITFTANRKYPGIQGPRHWLHSSPDGSQIAFLMKDDAGFPQLWTVSPNGGPPRQISRHDKGIGSAFTWSPDGKYIAHSSDGSIFLTDVSTGRSARLTASSDQAPVMPEACVISPDGTHIAFMRLVREGDRQFPKIIIISIPKTTTTHNDN